MAYAIVLPRDTQTQISEFIDNSCRELTAALDAAAQITIEIDKLSANPTLGASPLGTPLETRRIHRFTVSVSGRTALVELLYRINRSSGSVVFNGFGEIELPPARA